MASDHHRENPELRPFVLSNVTLTGTRIGAGAYGSVEEVTISGALCAAKKIHDVFQDRFEISEADFSRASTQFVKECQLMSTLHHPNIVQFLGVYFFEGSRLPALVMERLFTSLHHLLDPQMDPPPPADAPKPYFPLSLKCSILHNVASGLAFLHDRTPPIIHRDLSARNVLLTSGMLAKIADLGVARIVPRTSAAIMTKAPGAGIYMPPEALEIIPEEEEKERSKYGVSIDIFSFGVVAIFILSQIFPCNLLAPTYRDEQRRIVGRSELERRNKYMQMIYSQLRVDHPLLKMIDRCLDFPEDRPGIGEVLGLLEKVRGEERDDQMEMNKLELIQALRTQPRNQEVTELRQQLQSSEREKEMFKQQLMKKEAELTRAKETIKREQQQMQKQRDEIVQAKDRELAQAQQRLRQLGQQSSQQAVAVPHSIPPSKQGKLTVQFYRKKRAPCQMSRGSAATDDKYSYFATTDDKISLRLGDFEIYKHEWSTTKWEKLPPSPSCDSGLVIIDGELTTVGGRDRYSYTNKLYTFRQGQWVEHYPPMNTARSVTTAVSTSDGNYIVVIGGGDSWTTTVDVFHVKTRRWHELAYLPPPLNSPSATICGNQLHIIGHDGVGYSCSLQALLSTDQPPNIVKWTPLPQAPVDESTAATLCGHLVIVGGQEWLQKGTFTITKTQEYTTQVNSIHQLINGKWVKIGSMSIGRKKCLVVTPSPDKMMIVGGVGTFNSRTCSLDSVEECVVV